MTIAIKIENVSKKYLIGHQRKEQYASLRDTLTHNLRILGQRIRHPLLPNREEIEQEELWALREINLEIQQGDRVGIIGRNGAGKSTLLKILSRITEPSIGSFTMNGRVASLLEVGTGFHPELTGRENTFLNGAILGMSKVEIKRKFDEIVSFSGVEKFLDTPVKRYSSGMYVRLAFAVAAHLETEILVVDEVLAVGDAEFQKKCLGKMKDVGKNGRTVLFVSHNIGSINSLCTKAALLDYGKLVEFGNVNAVVSRYMRSTSDHSVSVYINEDVISHDTTVNLLEASIVDSGNIPAHTLFIDQSSAIRIKWRLNKSVPYMRVGIEIIGSHGVIVFSSMDTDSTDWLGKPREPGIYCETMKIPAFMLMPGQYTVSIFAGMPHVERFLEMANLLQFEVTDNQSHISHVRGDIRNGQIAIPMQWEVQFKPVYQD